MWGDDVALAAAGRVRGLFAGGLRTFDGLGDGHAHPHRNRYYGAAVLVSVSFIFGANLYGFALFYGGCLLACWNRFRPADRAVPGDVDGGPPVGGIADGVPVGGVARE